MNTILIQDLKVRMEKSLQSFQNIIYSFRTGRASPNLLDNIAIDYFGKKMPLKKISNITVENSNTLKISVFDYSIIRDIENSILNSKLEISPLVQGNIIKIILPSLTEDRRKNLFKLVRSEAEKTRVNMRNIRRNANERLKKYIKEKTINNDTEHSMQHTIQKITDDYIKKINDILLHKEKEIMQF
ncbi:ribosome recycling factor [Buchnera aphidicola]|uniref:ribosome recycling factor n=1 Tax=Buchnera aphidicola TaxID=9 RepID=UPI003464D380